MALESTTTINGLVSTNPPSGDPLGEADDHIRLIKAVLKAMFDQDGGAPIRKVEWARYAVPIGMIMIWYGTEATIPAGWKVCDGGTFARSDGAGNITTPNLRDKVLAHRGSLMAQGSSSGSDSGSHDSTFTGAHIHSGGTSSSGLHAHSTVTAPKVLTVDELPPHDHGGGNHNHAPMYGGNLLATVGPSSFAEARSSGGIFLTDTAYSGNIVAYQGGGHAHNHGIYSDGSHAHAFTTSLNGNHTHSTTISRRQLTYGAIFIMKI